MNLHIEDPIPGVTHVWEQLLPMSPGHTRSEGWGGLFKGEQYRLIQIRFDGF